MKKISIIILFGFLLILVACSPKEETSVIPDELLNWQNSSGKEIVSPIIEDDLVIEESTADKILNINDEINFEVEKKNATTLTISADLTNIYSSGDINRAEVVSCDSNFSADYDNPYILKKYVYPVFTYNINLAWDNLCDIPYKIQFFDSNDQLLGEQKALLSDENIESIMGFSFQHHSGFDSPYSFTLVSKGQFQIVEELDFIQFMGDETGQQDKCENNKTLRGSEVCRTKYILYFNPEKLIPAKYIYTLVGGHLYPNDSSKLKIACVDLEKKRFEINPVGLNSDTFEAYRSKYISSSDFETILAIQDQDQEFYAKIEKEARNIVGRGGTICDTFLDRIEILK